MQQRTASAFATSRDCMTPALSDLLPNRLGRPFLNRPSDLVLPPPLSPEQKKEQPTLRVRAQRPQRAFAAFYPASRLGGAARFAYDTLMRSQYCISRKRPLEGAARLGHTSERRGGRLPFRRGPVLIVDGDRNFRTVASRILCQAGFSTTQVASGEDALLAAPAERPGLVLLEVSLPDAGGFELCRQLRDQFGDELPIIFVSGERTAPLDRAAGLLMGGDDYLAKPCDLNELLARVRRPMARSRRHPHENGKPARDHRLTERELEVLQRLADGLRPGEIARDLFISPKTVASHLQHVLAKLGVHSRAEAVALAYREGLARVTATAGGGTAIQ